MNRSIPFFEYPLLYKNDKNLIIETLEDVGSRGAFIMQKDLAEFEKNLAEYLGCKYAIGVANATDGLEIALQSLAIEPGSEIICSAHTMLATASAIVSVGAVPVPADIGDDFLIDPKSIENCITKKTVGIMPTQLNGRTCEMDSIMKIALDNHLFVVEDAAQALGSMYKGKSAGTFGIASAISFFPAKVLGCLGDGGAVITNDIEVWDKMYQLHDHGRDLNGEVKCWGRNSRLDNFQALLLNKKLDTYKDVIAHRRNLAAYYDECLRDIEQIKLPPAPSNGERFDIYQNYEICCENRDALKEHLYKNNIGSIIQWGGKGIHQWGLLHSDRDLPRADKFFKGALLLPMNYFISKDDVEYICDAVRKFYIKN